MKTEKQVISKRDFLEELLVNEEIQDEIIMGINQRSKIRSKIGLLNWVLEEDSNE